MVGARVAHGQVIHHAVCPLRPDEAAKRANGIENGQACALGVKVLRDPVDERETLSITCPSTLLSQALRGEANLLEEIGSGNVTVDGELTDLFDVLLLLDTPSMSFPIVEP